MWADQLLERFKCDRSDIDNPSVWFFRGLEAKLFLIAFKLHNAKGKGFERVVLFDRKSEVVASIAHFDDTSRGARNDIVSHGNLVCSGFHLREFELDVIIQFAPCGCAVSLFVIDDATKYFRIR